VPIAADRAVLPQTQGDGGLALPALADIGAQPIRLRRAAYNGAPSPVVLA
jgi:hypothetical protein